MVAKYIRGRRCILCNSTRLYRLGNGYVKCKHCKRKYSLKKLRKDLSVLYHFYLEISARKTAIALGLSYRTVSSRFMEYRYKMAEYLREQFREMSGKISFEDYMEKKGQDGFDINLRNAQPVDFLERYWNFIKESDAILVLNLNKKGIENYIGGNTLMEMGFAYGHGKKIFMFNQIPERSERMHYVDEIIETKPIIINGDLNKIK